VSASRVFLLRHGETEWSRAGKHTSHTDIPLTELGCELAAATGKVGRRLMQGRRPALVMCSPRVRALLTAEFAGFHVDKIDERLVEWDYGDYEGITSEEIRASVPGWTVWTHHSPHGETPDQVAARADAVLADARAVGGDVVLIGHGHFSRVLVCRWLGRPATDGVHFAMDAAAWAVLGDERDVPRLDGLNIRPLE